MAVYFGMVSEVREIQEQFPAFASMTNRAAENPGDLKGRFEFVQNIFTLRKSHKSNSAAANLIFSNDGNNCICSNAGDNTVTIYKVNKETGELYTLSSLPVSGDYPKYISMFPDNKHILSMNNEGNSITIFTIHFDKGLIVMNGPELKISRPNNLVIKKLS